MEDNHVFKPSEIHKELHEEIEARSWHHDDIEIQVDEVDEGYRVQLRLTASESGGHTVSDVFPKDKDPISIANEMCKALSEET